MLAVIAGHTSKTAGVILNFGPKAPQSTPSARQGRQDQSWKSYVASVQDRDTSALAYPR